MVNLKEKQKIKEFFDRLDYLSANTYFKKVDNISFLTNKKGEYVTLLGKDSAEFLKNHNILQKGKLGIVDFQDMCGSIPALVVIDDEVYSLSPTAYKSLFQRANIPVLSNDAFFNSICDLNFSLQSKDIDMQLVFKEEDNLKKAIGFTGSKFVLTPLNRYYSIIVKEYLKKGYELKEWINSDDIIRTVLIKKDENDEQFGVILEDSQTGQSSFKIQKILVRDNNYIIGSEETYEHTKTIDTLGILKNISFDKTTLIKVVDENQLYDSVTEKCIRHTSAKRIGMVRKIYKSPISNVILFANDVITYKNGRPLSKNNADTIRKAVGSCVKEFIV